MTSLVSPSLYIRRRLFNVENAEKSDFELLFLSSQSRMRLDRFFP